MERDTALRCYRTTRQSDAVTWDTLEGDGPRMLCIEVSVLRQGLEGGCARVSTGWQTSQLKEQATPWEDLHAEEHDHSAGPSGLPSNAVNTL